MGVFKKNNSDSKQKLSKNELITLIISTSALLLTLGQLIFSSPLFSKIIYSPEVIGTEEKTTIDKEDYVSTYIVKNTGNKPAENLSINISCFAKDNVTIIPQLDYDIKEEKNGEPLKNIIIKTNTFLPSDVIIIIIYSDTNVVKSFEKQMREQGVNNLKLPSLDIIKHSDGFGVVQKIKH